METSTFGVLSCGCAHPHPQVPVVSVQVPPSEERSRGQSLQAALSADLCCVMLPPRSARSLLRDAAAVSPSTPTPEIDARQAGTYFERSLAIGINTVNKVADFQGPTLCTMPDEDFLGMISNNQGFIIPPQLMQSKGSDVFHLCQRVIR